MTKNIAFEITKYRSPLLEFSTYRYIQFLRYKIFLYGTPEEKTLNFIDLLGDNIPPEFSYQLEYFKYFYDGNHSTKVNSIFEAEQKVLSYALENTQYLQIPSLQRRIGLESMKISRKTHRGHATKIFIHPSSFQKFNFRQQVSCVPTDRSFKMGNWEFKGYISNSNMQVYTSVAIDIDYIIIAYSAQKYGDSVAGVIFNDDSMYLIVPDDPTIIYGRPEYYMSKIFIGDLIN